MDAYAKDIDSKKEQKTKFLMMIQEKESDILIKQEKITNLQLSDSHFNQRLEALLADVAARQKELNRYDKEKKEVAESLSELQEEQKESAQELAEIRRRLADYTKTIEHCNQLILDGMGQNTEIKTKLQRFETLEEQNAIKKAELAQKVLLHKSEEAGYAEKVAECKKNCESIEEQIEISKETIDDLEQDIAVYKQKSSELGSQIERTERTRIQEASKLEALRNLTERYDGYGNAIRKVMERKSDTPGVIGVVADIIKVDSKYETAMETALGGSIQNIVTQDEATAKKMVEYLKVNKLGRATFLPLTSITSKALGQAQEQAAKEQGVIGYAHTLVKVSKEYEELVKYLVGRILVVDAMDNALALAKKYNYTLRIVTLEGEQLNPGGSISGGAYKNNSNLLGRRREMEELEANILKLKNQAESLSKDKEEIKSKREALIRDIESEKAKLQELYLLKNTASLNLTAAKEQLDALKESYAAIEEEVNSLELKNRDNRNGAQELKDQLKKTEAAMEEAKKKTEVCTLSMERNRAIEEKMTEAHADLAFQCAGLEKNLQYVEENRSRLIQELDRLEREQKILKDENSSNKELILEQESAIEEAKKNITAWQALVTDLEELLTSLENKKEEIAKGQKSFFSRREELSKQLSDLDKESFRLSNNLERVQESMNAQADYMWQEYEVTVELAKKYRDESLPAYTGIKKEIGEIKSGIRALGDVNVNAIEDYRNLSERYELYSTQRNDLMEAEEKLRGIIEQLDTEMRKQFEEKFAAIKDQFDVVFRELFGGGKGTLELMEDEDVLTAGIRIIAQPPGKKLQNMMQLSGGEKALTAIALLFAIQNLKPSPFCLLDEIEAALDDSNVGRYAKYLHKLTQNTQFIVITHRRGTMNAADILYGITMQEKGVSTLVSVNLIEDKLEK